MQRSEMTEIIEEVVIKRGRYFQKVENRFIPRAIAVWLKNNPSFNEIPRGYVIHHLDYDELNDDISNLCLMYKTHHVAHHWKNINKKVRVSIDNKSMGQFYPTKRPTCQYHAPAKRFYLSFGEKSDQTGLWEPKKVWRDPNGKPMLTKEAAEKFAEALWTETQKYQSA
jgi:hypothetical protein